MLGALFQVVEQLFSKKATNIFPTKYAPKSIVDLLESGNIHGPVPVYEGYRGRLAFDYDKCVGCGLCERVCPANAIEFYPVNVNEKKSKRLVIYLSRCTYCSECVNICNKDALHMTPEFLTADFDKYGDSHIVGIEEKREFEVGEE